MFERETQTYQDHLEKLLAKEGKYVLIKGEDIIDTFDTYKDALKVAYDRFGLESDFLVKQISASEQIVHFSRDIQS